MNQTPPAPDDPAGLDADVSNDVPTGLVDRIVFGPAVRADRVAAARARLADGRHPSADDVAESVIAAFVDS
jgi:hypothetical protein